MILALYATIVALLLVLIFWKLATIKECVRFWILMRKLPTAEGKRFFFGHMWRVFGISIEEAWFVIRDWGRTSPPVYTLFLGPTLVFVGIAGPEELEATIGTMTNLTKAKGYKFIHRWLEEGLLTSTGAKWQMRRKISTPAFHFSILLEFVDTFNRETKNFVQELENKYLNQPVNVVPLISDFTLLTISEEAWHARKDWGRTSTPVYTLYFGPTLVLVGVMGPEEIEATLGPMKNLKKAKAYEFIHRWLEEGLLTSAGAKWQKRRKILTPAFHFSILLEFVDTFNRETKHFIEDIESKYLNQPVNVMPLISDFTLLTISETSMGTKLDLETKEGMEYKDAIYKMGDVVFHRVITPWLWYHGIFNITPLRKLEARALKVLHTFTDNIIYKRGENFKTFNEQFGDSFTKRKHPLLDILLNSKFKDNSIDDKGIREEVDTFMFEGHDTTAMCLNYTTMLLASHKDIQEEVYKEIVSLVGSDLSNEPTYTDLQQMTLLERCIKESLRLYPPVPMIGRTLSEDIPTKYGSIPKGALIFTHLWDVHRNPKHWPDPDVFDPSRHLPENSLGRHPFAFIPFSVGPRNCIGQRFAMLEMKSFFCGLLRKFVLEPVDTPETLVLVQDMILRPSKGIKVKFVLRNT